MVYGGVNTIVGWLLGHGSHLVSHGLPFTVYPGKVESPGSEKNNSPSVIWLWDLTMFIGFKSTCGQPMIHKHP